MAYQSSIDYCINGVIVATFRGFLRELDRAQRRSEKESQRRHKAYLKQKETDNTYNVVKEYENSIETITSFHKNCSKVVDWNEIINEVSPSVPVNNNENENKAKDKLAKYKPSFIDKIFKLKEKQKKKLEYKIVQAKIADDEIFEQENNKYKEDFILWQEAQRLAKGICVQNNEIMLECLLKYFDTDCLQNFSENIELGQIGNIIYVNVKIKNIDEIVSNQRLSLTSTGKLSVKSMPESKRNEIYQDYVCSSCLRVARETFAVVPVETFFVHMMGDIVNFATGHLEEQPILSSLISTKTLYKINFDNIDASSCMKNFKHNMSFSKSKGFDIVEKISF